MNRPSFAVAIPQRTRKAGHDCGRVDREIRHLGQKELAWRWNMSVRTLERWRWLKRGPKYIKLGGRVLYRLADVEAFESARERSIDGSLR